MVLIYIYIYILVMSYQQMINSSALSCMILAFTVNIVADDGLVIPESRENIVLLYIYIYISYVISTDDYQFRSQLYDIGLHCQYSS